MTKLSDTASISAVIAYARALIAWPRATQSSGQSIPSASFSRVRTSFPSSSKCPMHKVQSSESLYNHFSQLPLSANFPYQVTKNCIPCNCTPCQPMPSCCVGSHSRVKNKTQKIHWRINKFSTMSNTCEQLPPCAATQFDICRRLGEMLT